MFTPEEVNLLFEALEVWEKEANTKAFQESMLAMLLSEDREASKGETDQIMGRAKQETLSRKRESILLKAKLVQSLDDNAPSALFSRVEVAG